MVTFRNPLVRLTRIVASLADGSLLTLQAQMRARTWTVEDAQHRRLITIERSGARSDQFPRTARICEQDLSLSMIVALVVGHQQHESGDTIWEYFGDSKP